MEMKNEIDGTDVFLCQISYEYHFIFLKNADFLNFGNRMFKNLNCHILEAEKITLFSILISKFK